MLPVYQTEFLVEHRVGVVNFSYLPKFSSGLNSNLTYNNMTDIRFQGTDVDDENYPATENIPDQVPHPVNNFKGINKETNMKNNTSESPYNVKSEGINL